jgi:hypothetical protein
MYTPANFYSNFSYCSLNEAYGFTKTTTNIALSKISDFEVGSLWHKLLLNWSKNTAKVVLGDLKQGLKVVGSGAFIQKNTFITSAHILDFFLDTFDIVTHSGHTITVSLSDGVINKQQDWAIFSISSLDPTLSFPPIAKANHLFGQYAMIHHGNESLEPLVAIGKADPNPYYCYKTIVDIDGGPSSSGAILLNEQGEIALLHVSKKRGFATLRNQLPLQDILDEYARIKSNEMTSLDSFKDIESDFGFMDDELEHGYLQATIEQTDDSVSFSNEVFEEAKSLIFEILSESKQDFYSKAFGSPKTIYETQSSNPKMKSLRVDIQKPPKDFTNIQVQYKNESIAGVLISRDLAFYGNRISDITGIVNFSLGRLLDLIHHAKKTSKVFVAKIVPKTILK